MENKAMTDVEALKFQMLHQRSTKARFNTGMSPDRLYLYLLAGVQAEVESRHREFVMNDELEDQLTQMAGWLSSEGSRFGQVLCGGCGTGKSTLLRAFQRVLNLLAIPNPLDGNRPFGIRIEDSKDIARLCKSDYGSFRKLAMTPILGIDDLGVEPSEIMDFGNVLTPMSDLLSIRYDYQLTTILTTNLSPASIRERYGDRIADRLNEMVGKIIYKNASYRAG